MTRPEMEQVVAELLRERAALSRFNLQLSPDKRMLLSRLLFRLGWVTRMRRKYAAIKDIPEQIRPFILALGDYGVDRKKMWFPRGGGSTPLNPSSWTVVRLPHLDGLSVGFGGDGRHEVWSPPKDPTQEQLSDASTYETTPFRTVPEMHAAIMHHLRKHGLVADEPREGGAMPEDYYTFRRYARLTLSPPRAYKHYTGEEMNHHEYFDESGKRLGTVRVIPRGRILHIDWIGPSNMADTEGENSLGPEGIRSLKEQLKTHYPEAKFLSGLRMSGFRKRLPQKVVVPMRRKMARVDPALIRAVSQENAGPRTEGGSTASAVLADHLEESGVPGAHIVRQHGLSGGPRWHGLSVTWGQGVGRSRGVNTARRAELEGKNIVLASHPFTGGSPEHYVDERLDTLPLAQVYVRTRPDEDKIWPPAMIGVHHTQPRGEAGGDYIARGVIHGAEVNSWDDALRLTSDFPEWARWEVINRIARNLHPSILQQMGPPPKPPRRRKMSRLADLRRRFKTFVQRNHDAKKSSESSRREHIKRGQHICRGCWSHYHAFPRGGKCPECGGKVYTVTRTKKKYAANTTHNQLLLNAYGPHHDCERQPDSTSFAALGDYMAENGFAGSRLPMEAARHIQRTGRSRPVQSRWQPGAVPLVDVSPMIRVRPDIDQDGNHWLSVYHEQEGAHYGPLPSGWDKVLGYSVPVKSRDHLAHLMEDFPQEAKQYLWRYYNAKRLPKSGDPQHLKRKLPVRKYAKRSNLTRTGYFKSNLPNRPDKFSVYQVFPMRTKDGWFWSNRLLRGRTFPSVEAVKAAFGEDVSDLNDVQIRDKFFSGSTDRMTPQQVWLHTGGKEGEPLEQRESFPEDHYYRRKLPVRKYALPRRNDFLDALRRVRSSSQRALHQTAEQLARKLGLHPTKIFDALHDTPDGSTPGIAQAVYGNATPEQIHAAASWVGLTGNLPGVAVFHPRDAGPDKLYRWRQDGSGMDIRHRLDQFGIRSRILLPHQKGFDVVVPDQGNLLGNNIAAYLWQHKLQAESSPGHFHTIGSPDQGDARSQYRNVVTKQEGGRKYAREGEGLSTRDALIKSAVASPNDSTPRMVLADYLQEFEPNFVSPTILERLKSSGRMWVGLSPKGKLTAIPYVSKEWLEQGSAKSPWGIPSGNVYHATSRNRKGQAYRVRFSGKMKTWKRDPNRFRIPWKFGLYNNGEITENNTHEWLTEDPTGEPE